MIAQGQQQRTLVGTYASNSSFRSSLWLSESVIVGLLFRVSLQVDLLLSRFAALMIATDWTAG